MSTNTKSQPKRKIIEGLYSVPVAAAVKKIYEPHYAAWKNRNLRDINLLTNPSDRSGQKTVEINPNVSGGGITKYLSDAAGKIGFMHGNESPQAVAASAFRDEMSNFFETETDLQTLRDCIANAREDEESRQILCNIVHRIAECWVSASSTFGKFFDTVPLAQNQSAQLVCRWKQTVGVSCIGKDGLPETVQALREQSKKDVELCWLATNIYEYFLCDPHFGTDVRDRALQNVDLLADWMMKVDCLLKQYVIVGGAESVITGEFVTTGPKENRNYVADDKVHPDNLPAGNLLELVGNSANSRPRLEMLHAILHYAGQWGEGAFEGQAGASAMVPECIIIPSFDYGALFRDLQVNTPSNCYTDQLCDNFGAITIAGQRIIIRADNTLSPNAGIAYVQFRDRCIGERYTKPSLDMVDVEEKVRTNRGSICRAGVFGAGMYKCLSPNALAIAYRDPKAETSAKLPIADDSDAKKSVLVTEEMASLVQRVKALEEDKAATKKPATKKPKSKTEGNDPKTPEGDK